MKICGCVYVENQFYRELLWENYTFLHLRVFDKIPSEIVFEKKMF